MDKLNSWLTLGANIGLLIGLLLVAMQINRQTEIPKLKRQAEAFAWSVEGCGSRTTEDVPERLSRIYTNAETITDADLITLDTYLTREFTVALRERALASLGYATEAATELSAFKWAFTFLGNESALR